MPPKRPKTGTGRPRARKGVKLKPTELGPRQLRLDDPPAELQALARQVEEDGGAVLAAYREPLGGHALLFTALPVDKVEPTPFQRDVSDAHVLKLTRAMDKTRRYLDPIIAVREDGTYRTPNGGHRLTALKELGAKAVLALLVPELDDAVSQAVEKLKARGLTSPYLKAFVVARVNPLRFMKGSVPPFDELLATMTKRARGMDAAKIRTEDVARSGGAADSD